MNQYIKTRYDKLGERVVENLKSRHFDAYYVKNSDEAKELALSLISEGSSVSWGGSMTINEIGLCSALKSGSYNVIDRADYPPQEQAEAAKKAMFCDTYLMSANAISEDGILVNIDGNGNRVAALIYGPGQVIVVAGINKIVKDTKSALSRARNIAAPINCQRFETLKTPCRETGSCADCKSPDSICAQFVFTRICRPARRIKVIIVGENHGF